MQQGRPEILRLQYLQANQNTGIDVSRGRGLGPWSFQFISSDHLMKMFLEITLISKKDRQANLK